MNRIFDILSLIIVVAIIFVLVRPGSQGPSLVTAIGRSMTSLLKAATGGGSWGGGSNKGGSGGSRAKGGGLGKYRDEFRRLK